MSMLIKAGWDATLKDKGGLTPADLAEKHCQDRQDAKNDKMSNCKLVTNVLRMLEAFVVPPGGQGMPVPGGQGRPEPGTGCCGT